MAVESQAVAGRIGGTKAHGPGAEGNDGLQALAEGFEAVDVELLEGLAHLKPFDAAPCVAVGDGGAQLAPGLGRAGACAPPLG